MTRPAPLLAAALAASAALAAADVLKSNGIREEAIRENLISVLRHGLDNAPAASYSFAERPLAPLAPKLRAALVVAALDLAKAATASKEVREALVAAEAGDPPEDPRVAFARYEKEMKEKLAELGSQEVPPSFTAAQKKEYAEAIAMMKKGLQESLVTLKEQLPEQTVRYQKERAEWEAKVPKPEAAMKEALRRVLGEFLAGTEKMPFEAKLAEGGDRRRFADPALEEKPRWWKACWRAGKEPVEAGRAFAKKWLVELK